jgi:hypothetical protein
MGKYWSPVKKLSSWRKISVGMWAPPDDPTIYGYETLMVEQAIEYIREVEEATGVKISMAAFVVHVLAKAMAQDPALNVMVVNGRIQKRNTVDAFCQVMIPGDGQADLSGVQIRSVDEMNLAEIAESLKGRAKKVRAGEDQGLERQKKMIDRVPPWSKNGTARGLPDVQCAAGPRCPRRSQRSIRKFHGVQRCLV